jgi:hypothetical protein
LEIASKNDIPIAFLLYDWEEGEQNKSILLKSIFILRQQPTMHSTAKYSKKDLKRNSHEFKIQTVQQK